MTPTQLKRGTKEHDMSDMTEWVMVPRRWTQKMLQAAMMYGGWRADRWQETWERALAAAPTPPATQINALKCMDMREILSGTCTLERYNELWRQVCPEDAYLPPAQEAQPVARVYLVPSGQVSESGIELHERHEKPVPMADQEVLYASPPDVTRRIRDLEAERDRWISLYRRAVNEANGLTNYVEDRPELRSAEKRLTVIEAEARAALGRES